jgi:small subunit ribosomal protein S14
MFKKLLYKDKQTRKKYKQLETYSFLNKVLKKNLDIYDIPKSDFLKQKKVSKLSKSQIRNRCIFSGRGNGVVSKFKISRMFFRKYAGQGLIAGVYKSN